MNASKYFLVYAIGIGEGKHCHRCNAFAYWIVDNANGKAATCSAHLGSTIVQAAKRGLVPNETRMGTA